MVDIIIPAYNSHSTIIESISSILLQDIVNKINVIIVDDNSSKNYDEIVNFFKNKISIKVIKMDKNYGPGIARNYGMENSNGDYIVFLDSDDTFYDCYSVSKLYNKIIQEKADLVIGNIIEETENGKMIHKKSESWLHGKIYKRKFLEKNNIKFNESRYNEDVYFNELIFLSNAKIFFLDEFVSIWKYNKDSLTRKSSDLIFRKKFYSSYVSNMISVLNLAIFRKYANFKIAKLSYDLTLFLYYSYILKNNYDIFDSILDDSKEIFDINNKYIKYLTNEQKNEILSDQFSQMKKYCELETILLPDITYNNFINGERFLK